MIPISVIVNTRNSERVLGDCLAALGAFGELIVLDSASSDRTRQIAAQHGARLEEFTWNGHYPKKRQWALDNLALKYDYVFFVDADEILTPELVEEIARLDFAAAGYFIKGRYLFEGKLLRFGMVNKKLSLFDRSKFSHPVIDDLDIPGMGEIEGHYQPVPRDKDEKIGRLRHYLVHDAYDDGWRARHERYARWEAEMNIRKAWPGEVSAWRGALKRLFRATPLRSFAAFLYCYYFRLGVLDGARGYKFAQSRAFYYLMISRIQAEFDLNN
jgi:glycosyltransferase involved in cell wall biosynthesis